MAMTETFGDESVHVVDVRVNVVEPVGGHIGIAEAPQVGNDHLETGSSQRLDDTPPHAFGLGPAVHQQQGNTAHSFANIRLPETAPVEVLRGESARVDVASRLSQEQAIPRR